MDWSLKINEFELQSCSYVHFRTSNPEKSMNLLIPSPYGLKRITVILLQGWIWHRVTREDWHAIKQRYHTIPYHKTLWQWKSEWEFRMLGFKQEVVSIVQILQIRAITIKCKLELLTSFLIIILFQQEPNMLPGFVNKNINWILISFYLYSFFITITF